MARTTEAIQADIALIQIAISDLYAGKRLTTLIVGTGDSQRRYSYQEITPENLKAHLNELYTELLSVATDPTPTFRNFASMPMIVGKAGVR